jgi:hypothetical protein
MMDNVFMDKLCIRIFLKNPAKALSAPFIPPDALIYYADFVDHFKLSSRGFTTAQIETCLKAYVNQDFNGDLLEILDGPGLSCFNSINYDVLKKNNFFEKTSKCNSDCNNCNYCNKLMKDAIVINSDFLKKRTSLKDIFTHKNLL